MFKLNIEHLISTRISYIRLFLALQSCYINILPYCLYISHRLTWLCHNGLCWQSLAENVWYDWLTCFSSITQPTLTGQNVKSQQMTRLLLLKCPHKQLWVPLGVHHLQVTCHCLLAEDILNMKLSHGRSSIERLHLIALAW